MKKKIIIILSTFMLLNGCGMFQSPNNGTDSNIPYIEQDLTELVVTYNDGLTETITNDPFLRMFRSAINNYLVVSETHELQRYETNFSVTINNDVYTCYSLSEYDSPESSGLIKIGDRYYKHNDKISNTQVENDDGTKDYVYGNIFNLILLAHSLNNGSMKANYPAELKASTINELFTKVAILRRDENIVYPSNRLPITIGGRVYNNGTDTVYDFNKNEYLFSFFDIEKMGNNQIVYNWQDRTASMNHCTYDRNSEEYVSCSQFEQEWIETALYTFLKCPGYYMDESDFLEQEKDVVFEYFEYH